MSAKDEYELSPRERKFAELFLNGIPAGRAYEQAGYSAKGDSADASASRLLKSEKVSAFVNAQRKKIADGCLRERWELVAWLQDAIWTPVGEVGEDHPLALEMTKDEVGKTTVRTKVKMVSKMDAVKQLSAMMGWNAAEKVKISADDKLLSLLGRIRRRE